MSKEIQRLASIVMIGIGLSSPISGQSSENIVNKNLSNSPNNIDTTREIETSGTLSKEEQQLINVRIKNFLDKEGDYDDKNIINSSLYSLGNYKRDLGYCGLSLYSVILQGVLVGHVEFDNRDFVLVGTKNSSGKKIVTLVEWQIDKEIEAKSWVGSAIMVGGGSSTSYTSEFLNSKEEVVSLLNNNMGDMVLFNLYKIEEKQTNDETFKGLDGRSYKYFLEEVVPKTVITNHFVSGLCFPPKKELTEEDNKYRKSLGKGGDIVNFASYSEVMEFLKTNKEVPIVASITHRK
jgi:hypothetical protein